MGKCMVGDAGPAGPTGGIGPMGLRGDTGPAGPIGNTGPAGMKGETGQTGLRGDSGPRGQKGEAGHAGQRGDTGPRGLRGDTGPRGLKGDSGPRGPKGDTGDAGSTGAAGADAIIQRVQAAGGAQALTDGSLSISLTWENTDAKNNDMDLYVTPPHGSTIYYSNKQSCGGVLDVDQRQGSRAPVENVCFTRAPTGLYKVEVENFAGNTNQSVPCKAMIRKNGRAPEIFDFIVGGVAKSRALVTTFTFQ